MSAVRLFNLGVFLIVLSLVFPKNACCDQPEKPRESLKILFAGDIMLDGGPGNFVANGKDPFAACAPLFEGVDLCIGNLECVLGRGGEQQLKPYVFRGATDSPRFLKKYFHAVSFAFDYFPVDPPEWTGWVAVLEIEPTGAVGLEIKTIILDAAGCPKPAPMD